VGNIRCFRERDGNKYSPLFNGGELMR
jgi:hypothetical protein